MQVDDLVLVSVDDHVVEPPHLFEGRLSAKAAERAPFIETQANGREVWMFEGAALPNVGLNAVAGRVPEEYGVDPLAFSEMRPGCYDIDERVKDMDRDGIQAQLCFPSLPGFAGSTFFAMEDKELAHACVQAWNDFAIDEWCAAYPDRQIPLAILPYWDVELSTREVERVAAKGARAVSCDEMPHSAGLPS